MIRRALVGAALVLCATLAAEPAPRVATARQAEPPAADGSRDERPLRVEPRPTRTKRSANAKPSAPKPAARETPEREKRSSGEEAKLTRVTDAVTAGRLDEARTLLAAVDVTRLPRDRADDAAHLAARLELDGKKQRAAFEAYLKEFARGRHRREATLSLARLHYVEGDYGEAERLLTIFSPGVEKDLVGREALILRGQAQLGRGDASGAHQFLVSCETDLRGSAEEESYYFAWSQAALRAGKPSQAIDALRVLLEKHPQGGYAPQALYAMGVGLERLGRAPDAANVFRQVAQRFPASYEATRVRDRGIRPGAAAAAGLPIGGGFALQIGAFSRRDLADALARDMRLAGVTDVSVKQGGDSPPLYRVRAGAFATRDEARALGERLRRERGFSSTVVPR
jgi:TolA-binding protein